MAKRNKVEISEDKLPHANSTTFKTPHGGNPSAFSCLWRPLVLRMTLNMCFAWGAVSLLYYGLSLNTRNMAGSIYLNFLLLAGSEIVGYVINLLFLDRIGRRPMICGGFLLAGIACIGAGLVPANLTWLIITLSLFGKFSVSSVFSSVYIYTAELYPTFLRNTVIGIVAMCGKIGSTLSPVIADLGASNDAIPMIIFGGLAVLAGLLILDLPETTNVNLLETVEDTEHLFRSKRICRRREYESIQ